MNISASVQATQPSVPACIVAQPGVPTSEKLGYRDYRALLEAKVNDRLPIGEQIRLAKGLLACMYDEKLMEPQELAPWDMRKEGIKQDIWPLMEMMPWGSVKAWGVRNNGNCKKVFVSANFGRTISLPVCLAVNRHLLMACQNHNAPKLYAPVMWDFNPSEPFANSIREINRDFPLVVTL